MKKLIILGDTHGRTTWKEILNKEKEFDKFIFIGDYLDTHENITGEQQLENFKDIRKFKEDNKDKVVLLFGNHDFHYLDVAQEQYSGFQSGMQWVFKDTLDEALKKDLLQMCYIQDKFLFTHAGVSKTWLKNSNYTFDEPLMTFINEIFKYQPKHFKFNGRDPYGDDITQSPIWIRPESLFEDGLKEYIHVVGHTTQNSINPPKGESNIWMIDTLGTSGEYLVITDNKIAIEKL